MRRAFTLIELLVVIGIIALLTSVLMPVAVSARRASHSTQCKSNLRTLSQAFHIYLIDSKGRYPKGGQHLVPKDEDWAHFTAGRNRENGVVTRLLPFDLRIYQCPSDEPTKAIFWSYTVNSEVCCLYETPTLRASQIHRPSEVAFIICESRSTLDDTIWYPIWLGSGKNVLSNRHQKGAWDEPYNYRLLEKGDGNVAHVDGSVATVTRANSYKEKFYNPRLR